MCSVKCATSIELFTTQSQLLTTLSKKAFENIAGKGDNAGNQCYPSYQGQNPLLSHFQFVVYNCFQYE